MPEAYLDNISDPYNDYEPVDSSAAAIAAQGLIRLGRFLGDDCDEGSKHKCRPFCCKVPLFVISVKIQLIKDSSFTQSIIGRTGGITYQREVKFLTESHQCGVIITRENLQSTFPSLAIMKIIDSLMHPFDH